MLRTAKNTLDKQILKRYILNLQLFLKCVTDKAAIY
jgi:hypothetical protein